MCKRLSTTVDLGPGINKYPPLRIQALTPRRALEEFTPQTHQPYSPIGLDLELLNWALEIP